MKTVKMSLVFLIVALATFALVDHLTIRTALLTFTVAFIISVLPSKVEDECGWMLLMVMRTLLGFITLSLTLML